MKAYAIPSHARVIATLGCFLAVGLASFVATAPAKAYEEYKGHIRGTPQSKFNLTTFGVSRKHDMFVYVRALVVPITCENGPNTLVGHGDGDPYLLVRSGWPGRFDSGPGTYEGGSFSIGQDTGDDESSRFAGELKRRDRAVGIFRYRATFNQPLGVCKTGRLEWVAHKR